MKYGETGAAGLEEPGATPGKGVAGLTERLMAILRGVEARAVGTNGDALWFESEQAAGTQLRLNPAGEPRCYARSANFSLSYAAPGAARVPAALLERVKQIDAVPIPDAAAAFRAAVTAVAAHFGNAESGSGVVWEHPQARALNVVFLDLCARVLAARSEPLPALHWGYWPAGAAATADDHDPMRAYSEALLALIPDGVRRVLDVGAGLGYNARLLSARGDMCVTAVTPVPHHCERIQRALPQVEVRCGRFETLRPERRYDLLLFSESLNHFALDEPFLRHCAAFLDDPGYLLVADDLTPERARWIETQTLFRVLQARDISENVAPTGALWMRQLPIVAAYHQALLSILDLYEPTLGEGVRRVLDGVANPELRQLFSGRLAPPESKGRYMIYLLAPTGAAAADDR